MSDSMSIPPPGARTRTQPVTRQTPTAPAGQQTPATPPAASPAAPALPPLPVLTPAHPVSDTQKAAEAFMNLPIVKFSFSLFMREFLKLLNTNRRADRKSWVDEANQSASMMHEAAKDMRDAARDAMIGALAGAGFKMASAGVGVAGGAYAAKSSESQVMMNRNATTQSIGQGVTSLGDAANSTAQYESGLDQADRVDAEGQSQRAKATEDSEKSQADEEAQMVQFLIQSFQKEEDSRHEAMRASV